MRAELTALQNRDGIQNLSLDERGRERTYRPFQGVPRPHNTKVQYFLNLPGENFLAWRSQFQVIADYHRWSDEEAKQLMYAYMKGTALESVMDIPLTGPETAKDTLDEYQLRFLLESNSHLLRAQFACVVQLPNESVQKLHARISRTRTRPQGMTSSLLKGSSRPSTIAKSRTMYDGGSRLRTLLH